MIAHLEVYGVVTPAADPATQAPERRPVASVVIDHDGIRCIHGSTQAVREVLEILRNDLFSQSAA